MDKEDFLQAAMQLLKQYISEDEGVALDLLDTLGYSHMDADEIIHLVMTWKS